ncbi:alpha/beta hydrolase [Atopobacter phocae]|uniref:alpha/beta hydrolase n=1 Tax=Atopobacter phocae TaxID=136492 RepID=UPI0004B03F3C|nr:alpha/beta hydrolase [Atopobacter phocae]
MKTKRKKIIKRISLSVIAIISLTVVIGLGYGTVYLHNYAIKTSPGSFESDKRLPNDEEKSTIEQFDLGPHQLEWLTQMSQDNLKLSAALFTHPHKKSTPNRLVIIAHGYARSPAAMERYAKLFYKMGYDVLLPAARGHGLSEGEYRGMGWMDRLDYKQWIDNITSQYASKHPEQKTVEIGLFGLSMGAATVMMTSGEDLPDNVKLIIEDCGYTSIDDEFTYQLKETYNLPRLPMIPLTSFYTQFVEGFNFKEGSATNQLRNNRRPILFIHGDTDDFVPTKMVNELYEATQGPKDIWITKGVGHAKSLETYPKEYEERVAQFLTNYWPE